MYWNLKYIRIGDKLAYITSKRLTMLCYCVQKTSVNRALERCDSPIYRIFLELIIIAGVTTTHWGRIMTPLSPLWSERMTSGSFHTPYLYKKRIENMYLYSLYSMKIQHCYTQAHMFTSIYLYISNTDWIDISPLRKSKFRGGRFSIFAQNAAQNLRK
jgi:hypothetical protein